MFPGLGIHVASLRSSDSLSFHSHPAFSFPKYALQPVSGNKVKKTHELRTKGLEEQTSSRGIKRGLLGGLVTKASVISALRGQKTGVRQVM